MTHSLLVPVVAVVAFSGLTAANEWSHGSVAGTLGLGYRHMFDYGGYHCAAHDGSSMGQEHMRHMHADNATMPHGACPGGPGMHGQMGNMTGTMGGGP